LLQARERKSCGKGDARKKSSLKYHCEEVLKNEIDPP